MGVDLGLSLLTRGYTCHARMADGARNTEPAVRAVRLLGRPALLMAGREAVRFFYDQSRISRDRAVPAVLADEIFGRGSVHGLDGPAHVARKRLHLDTLDPDATARLTELVCEEWDRSISEYVAGETLSLHDVLVDVLGSAVQRWVGAKPTAEHRERSRSLASIVDGFGGIDGRQLRGRSARRRCEAWAIGLIRAARAEMHAETPVLQAAQACDEHGRPLPEHDAAVELLNLLRPVVAIAWFGSFIPLAFAERLGWASRLRDGEDDRNPLAFVHELRRHYPFVPMLAGRVRGDQDWHGRRLHDRQRVILNIVATNHDPRLWPQPWTFRPERFVDNGPEAFSMVAQGGGDASAGHRCPGELVTISLLVALSSRLAALDHEPATRLAFSPRRMPTVPFGGPRLRLGTRFG